jgi:lipopolysaccharide/colanic/teichoic acid biosynthesis glycosyltransferase
MKRASDVVLSALTLVLTSPFLALAAAAIAIEDRGPVLFRQTRIGRGGGEFEILKLRTMVVGDMSVVGPRPTVRWQVERYTQRQRRRLEVKPGITGWAQIHGRAALPWDERIELDVWYVEHASLWLDLKILARTPLALFSGTYKGETGGWRAEPPEETTGRPQGPAAS